MPNVARSGTRYADTLRPPTNAESRALNRGVGWDSFQGAFRSARRDALGTRRWFTEVRPEPLPLPRRLSGRLGTAWGAGLGTATGVGTASGARASAGSWKLRRRDSSSYRPRAPSWIVEVAKLPSSSLARGDASIRVFSPNVRAADRTPSSGRPAAVAFVPESIGQKLAHFTASEKTCSSTP